MCYLNTLRHNPQNGNTVFILENYFSAHVFLSICFYCNANSLYICCLSATFTHHPIPLYWNTCFVALNSDLLETVIINRIERVLLVVLTSKVHCSLLVYGWCSGSLGIFMCSYYLLIKVEPKCLILNESYAKSTKVHIRNRWQTTLSTGLVGLV